MSIYFIGIPSPDLIKLGNENVPFYSDVKIIVPLIIAILALLTSGAIAVACLKKRE